MRETVKVLVTGAGSLLGQGIIRALQASSLKASIVAVDPSPLAAGLYWVQAPYVVPPVAQSRYLDCIEEILARERPDAVLIGTDVELGVFAAHRERLERQWGAQIVVSSPGVVAIADDKWETYRFLRAHGFACPDSCLPGGERDLVRRIGFPLVVKPRVGARSKGLSVVRNWHELRAALRTDVPVIVQELVGTDETEYTAGALCFGGRWAGSIVMRRELRDGNTFRAFVDEYAELNEVVRKWTEALRPWGPVNFQFRIDEGRAKVFEINARFSGTTPLRAHAGFNEVEMVLRRVLGGAPADVPRIRRVTILRHWSETVVEPSARLEDHGVGPATDRVSRRARPRAETDFAFVRADGRDAERWRDVLSRFPRPDVYYTPEYALAYESSGEEPAAALLVCGGDAVIHPVIVRDLSGLSWAGSMQGPAARCDFITPYGYGGPLCSAEDPQRRAALVREFDRRFRALSRERGAVTEFVRFHPLLATHQNVDGDLDVVQRGETIWLEVTTDEERVMAAMSPTARNKIRRARREGVVVRAHTGPEAIRTFTALYYGALDRLAAPRVYYFPAQYFDRLGQLLGAKCEILVAWRDASPLWAGIFLREGEFLHYHLSGSAGSRVPGVNNLGLLEASLRGAARGSRVFHLGGGVGSRSDSLLAFKASVGNRRAAYWTGQRIFDPAVYARLCDARRNVAGTPAAVSGSYFPAYRAPSPSGIQCVS